MRLVDSQPEEHLRECNIILSGPIGEVKLVLFPWDAFAPSDRIMDLIIATVVVASEPGEALAGEEIDVCAIAFISWRALRPVRGHFEPWLRARVWLTPLAEH
jgi:hypothetical protein